MTKSHSDRIIHHMEIRRIFTAILAVLEPHDMPAIALRLEGLREFQIARLLGISRTTLCALDRDLKARIMTEVPEAWLLIRDLRRRGGGRENITPLERGWLSDDFGAQTVDVDGAIEPQTPDLTPPPPEKSPDRDHPLQAEIPPRTETETSAHGTQRNTPDTRQQQDTT